MSDLVFSPSCQLPLKAFHALGQATVDELVGDGAFAEMAHLPAAHVLTDAIEYAKTMVKGVTGDPSPLEGPTHGDLIGIEVLHPDRMFLSQVLALRDLLMVKGVQVVPEETDSPTLGALVSQARDVLLDRVEDWKKSPGRRDDGFQVLSGDLDALYPQAAVPADRLPPHPERDADLFAVYIALPLFAPFLVKEDDTYVAPRLR